MEDKKPTFKELNLLQKEFSERECPSEERFFVVSILEAFAMRIGKELVGITVEDYEDEVRELEEALLDHERMVKEVKEEITFFKSKIEELTKGE